MVSVVGILPTKFQRNLSGAALIKSSYSSLFESGILRNLHIRDVYFADCISCITLLDDATKFL